jgi:hypothetical protein
VGGRRGYLAPQLVDQPFGADDLCGPQRKQSEQRTDPAPRQCDGAVAADDLQRAEKADLHPVPYPFVTPPVHALTSRTT